MGYFYLGLEGFSKLIDACNNELYIFEDVIFELVKHN